MDWSFSPGEVFLIGRDFSLSSFPSCFLFIFYLLLKTGIKHQYFPGPTFIK